MRTTENASELQLTGCLQRSRSQHYSHCMFTLTLSSRYFFPQILPATSPKWLQTVQHRCKSLCVISFKKPTLVPWYNEPINASNVCFELLTYWVFGPIG